MRLLLQELRSSEGLVPVSNTWWNTCPSLTTGERIQKSFAVFRRGWPESLRALNNFCGRTGAKSDQLRMPTQSYCLAILFQLMEARRTETQIAYVWGKCRRACNIQAITAGEWMLERRRSRLSAGCLCRSPGHSSGAASNDATATRAAGLYTGAARQNLRGSSAARGG